MVGRHHQCNEHEIGQTPGDGEGQGGLACCSSWGRKESDTTGQLNTTTSYCISMSVRACLVAQSCLFVTAWTMARQAPLSMEFSRKEDWNGLPFPPPGDLPDPGIKPMSPALAGRFFTTDPSGKPHCISMSPHSPFLLP